MKNKAVVIKGINDLQGHFGDEVTAFDPKVKRDVLDILCLGYMHRYVKAQRAPSVTAACPKCAGTGDYIFPDGRISKCFRCKGKGHTDAADVKRNYGYDLHHQPAPAAQDAEAANDAANEESAEAKGYALEHQAELLDEAQQAQMDYDPDDLPF